MDQLLGRVVIPNAGDRNLIPSQQPLYAILESAVRHMDEFPTHGTDCVCMDSLIYEVRAHATRALPERKNETYTNTDEWARDFYTRARVKHILSAVSRSL